MNLDDLIEIPISFVEGLFESGWGYLILVIIIIVIIFLVLR